MNNDIKSYIDNRLGLLRVFTKEATNLIKKRTCTNKWNYY